MKRFVSSKGGQDEPISDEEEEARVLLNLPTVTLCFSASEQAGSFLQGKPTLKALDIEAWQA